MGELYNKLDAVQTKMMTYYINNFGGEANCDRASTEYLMREWDRCKSDYLYKLLGNQFYVEKEVAYAKEEGKLIDELDSALWNRDNAMYVFRKGFDAFLWAHRHDLGDDYWKVKDLMNTNQLATNVYAGETFEVNAPEDRVIKVQNGCRPVKLVGKIVNAYGELHDEYEAFRTVHSQILNQKMLKGTMCLSILPIDYMTMSDNDSDWSSCMSWKESGCYCRGTVEMMNSPMVVVGYLKGSSDMYVCDGCYCSNKKWRELFIINKDIVTGVKGYPYQNAQFVTECINWLKALAKANLGWNYGDAVMKFVPGNTFTYGNVDYKFNFSTETMYNDFGTCDHYISINPELDADSHRYNYSGREMCMCCGTLSGSYDGEGNLTCDDCNGGGYCCEDCGERLRYEDDRYWLDDRCYCRACYEDHAKYDFIADEDHDRDDFVDVYVVPNEVGEITSKQDLFKCNTFETYRYTFGCWGWTRKFNVDEPRVIRDNWSNYRYVYVDDIKPDYKELVFENADIDSIEDYVVETNDIITQARLDRAVADTATL